MTHYRSFFLLCACGLYGLFGSPTPDGFGWVELVIGACLVLAVGITGLREAVFIKMSNPLWQSAAQILLLFGLSVPLLIAVLSGHSIGLIIRDLVPFLFMMLPLFMAWPFKEERSTFDPLMLYGCIFIGVAFAVRAALGSDPLLYLANMPTVLMSAILCAGTALVLFIERFSWRSLLPVMILLSMSSVALWPIIATQQRASLGAFVAALFLIGLWLLWQNPRRMLVVLGLLSIAFILLWPEITQIMGGFSRKSALVGSNMRFEEWAGVWQEISAQPLSLFFGKGWGAGFHSPAVADIKVNYTHSLLSSMLLKTGLIGLCCSGLYLYTLARFGFKHFTAYPLLSLALGLPFLIDIFLYASFKSLDFGLILMLIVALGIKSVLRIETKSRVLY